MNAIIDKATKVDWIKLSKNIKIVAGSLTAIASVITAWKKLLIKKHR